jgi:hypothetical protein
MHRLLNRLSFSPVSSLGTLVKNHLTICSRIYFWAFCKYFILFDTVISRIICLISFSDCLLLVFRITTEFCVLILCPYNFAQFTGSKRFSSFLHKVMSWDQNSFTSFIPTWTPFISFSCLISLSRLLIPYKIEAVRGAGILALFLPIEEKLSFFYYWAWC